MNIDNILFKVKTLIDKKEPPQAINEKINELLNPIYYDSVINTVDVNQITTLKKEIKDNRDKRLKSDKLFEKILKMTFIVVAAYILICIFLFPFGLIKLDFLMPLAFAAVFSAITPISSIFLTRKYLLNEINKDKEIKNHYKEDIKKITIKMLQALDETKNSEINEEASYLKKYLLKNLKEYEEENEKEENFFVKLKYKIDEDFFNYNGLLENKKIKKIASEDEQLDNYYKTLIPQTTRIK